MSTLEDDNVKLEILRTANAGDSHAVIAETIGVTRSTVSKFLRKETHKEWWASHVKPIASGALRDHHAKIERLGGNKFIITSAQNNTFVHSKFLKSLETMAAHVDARIIVGTFSYNKTGFQNLSKSEGEWFDNKITDYILDEPAELADGLIWCGELNILPTATNPLSGFHSYTKGSSGIIPHAKVQLESLPMPKHGGSRMLYTTGAVTQRNYIEKKSGQKASFHHIFGAVLVEIDSDGDWFVRQLIADTDTGEFQDLDVLYTPTGVVTGQRVEAINYGDIHAEKGDLQAYRASFGGGDSMLNTLKPRYQFVHDVLDFTARNHHTINDPYVRFIQYSTGRDYVENNIEMVAGVLDAMNRDFCQTVVVESNHDLALQKWLKTADYKQDPANALIFLELQYESYKAMAAGDTDFSVFEYVVKNRHPSLAGIKFLKTDESFMICGDDGVECGNHGNIGVGGSRGSVVSYQRLSTRQNIGHSHSACIKDGVYQAGVLGKLDMGYNVGGSTWSQSNIVTFVNSKRQIITLKNGKWRANN